MRNTSQEGIDLIKRFEGFSATTYIDAAGHPTIGYGHLIRKGQEFNEPISKKEGELLLRHDVRVAELAVLRMINVELTDQQFDALVSFTFNLGGGALQRSTLRRKVNRQEHEEVPREFLRWIYAGGRKLRGLLRRRTAEATLYADGTLEVPADDIIPTVVQAAAQQAQNWIVQYR